MSEQHIKLDDTAFRWDHLIKDLTLRLRAKGIQSVLWDRTAVGHYGVPMGFGGAWFVIDDDQISHTITALDSAGLVTCKDGPSCKQVFTNRIPELWPAVHLHIDQIFGIEDNIQFNFYSRSKTLPELPALATLVSNPHPEILRTNVDQRLDREGRLVMEEHWRNGKDLWIPSIRALIRSFILLAVRSKEDDAGDNRAREYWVDQVIDMLIYLPKQGRFNGDAGEDVQPLLDWILKGSYGYRIAMDETISRVGKKASIHY